MGRGVAGFGEDFLENGVGEFAHGLATRRAPRGPEVDEDKLAFGGGLFSEPLFDAKFGSFLIDGGLGPEFLVFSKGGADEEEKECERDEGFSREAA